MYVYQEWVNYFLERVDNFSNYAPQMTCLALFFPCYKFLWMFNSKICI